MNSSSPTQTVVRSASVLGKRKGSRKVDSFVLHLASSPEPNHHHPSDSDFEPPQTSTSIVPSPSLPIIVNGTLIAHTKRCYKCTYQGCDKAYSKPSRLEEHERSHTGLRPFVCSTCDKSYLRETHLHAHARSHLPESARPLVCSQANCERRFWTPQHLRAHEDLHKGEKPFTCHEPSCTEAFSKHHQLRTHMCSAHAPPGTKPYQCNHVGCTKSFTTSQHLRTHSKVHEEKRYTCVHPNCLPMLDAPATYYPTWTALQHHLRTVHPPTCSHPSCNGRTFSSQHNLRVHQKLHEEREVENELNIAAAGSDEEEDPDEGPRKKRRGGEIGRDWKCEVDGCRKDFKSKKALATHTNITHLGRRDYFCPHESCKHTFGYKHLLQRHFAKAHSSHTSDSTSGSSSESSDDETPRKHKATSDLDIDTITGNAYAVHAQEKIKNAKALQCPYPHLEKLTFVSSVNMDTDGGIRLVGGPNCDYVFSRAYDLRRHLKAVHEIEVEKDSVDEWVKRSKRG